MYSKNLVPDMPPQRLSDAQKTPAWAKKNVQAIANFSGGNDSGRISMRELQRNRNILSQKIDMEELRYVVDPRNTGVHYADAPARLRKHNLILPRVQDIQAQANDRNSQPYAKPLAGGAFERVKGKVNEAMQQWAEFMLMQKLAAQGVPVQMPQQPPPDPQTAAEQILSEYKDVSEIDGNKMLSVLIETYKTKNVCNAAWRASTCSGELLGMVDEARGVPICKPLDSAKFTCQLAEGEMNVDEASWQRYDEYVTFPDIIDEFGDELTASQLADLEGESDLGRGGVGDQLRWGYNHGGYGPAAGDGGLLDMPNRTSNVYHASPLRGATVEKWDADKGAYVDIRGGQVVGQHDQPAAPDCTDDGQRYANYYLYRMGDDQPGNKHAGYRGGLYRVSRVWWKSQRRFRRLYWLGAGNHLEHTIVADNYVLSAQEEAAGSFLKWEYMVETWQGVQVGSETVLRARRMKWQNGRLGCVGTVIRAVGEDPIPVVSLLRHIQLQHMAVMYAIEREIGKAQGKKIIVYVDDLPNFDPHNPERSFDMFQSKLQNDDIVYLTRHKAGGYSVPAANGGMPVDSIDMTASQNITQFLIAADKLERLAAMVSGVPNERLGMIAPSQAASSVDAGMNRASFMMEPVLEIYDNWSNRLLETLLHAGMACYANDSWMQLALTNNTRQWMSIDPANLNDTLLGVTMATSPKSAQLLKRLQESSFRRWESGAMDVLTMVRTQMAESLPELFKTLSDAEAKLQEMQSQGQQAAAQKAEADRIDKNKLDYAKLDKDITVALIGAKVDLDTAEGAGRLSEFQDRQLANQEAESSRKADENNRRIEQQSKESEQKATDRNHQLMLGISKLLEDNRKRLLEEKNQEQQQEQFEREQKQQDDQHKDHMELAHQQLALDARKVEKQGSSSK